MDFSKPDTGRIISELSDKVYELVLQYRGSITAEHNDGIIRTPYLERMYGESIIGIFSNIKRIFDHKNILFRVYCHIHPGYPIEMAGPRRPVY